MGKTLDLGTRMELHSMDKHCADISLGLYRRDIDGVPHVLVHTYSSADGAQERAAFISKALVEVAGLEEVAAPEHWLRFPCRSMHQVALKRVFLDLCKLETGAALDPKPMTVFDKKAEGEMTAVSLGDGHYRIDAEEGAPKGAKRSVAIAKGFAKLCEMELAEDQPQVRFPCGCAHDRLIGTLFFRAQNVRASLREQEASAGRGVLSAPSQQET